MENPQPPVPQPSGSSGSGLSERQWALAIHLSGLLGFVTPGLNVVAPLVLWLIKKQDNAVLDAVGKRVLNFQISYLIYGFGLGFLALILTLVLIGWLLFPLVGLIGVAWLVLTILGAVKESDGVAFEYPFVIKFLK